MNRSQIVEIKEYSSHKKDVSVIGARFLKAIKRQIHMLKKTH